MACGLPYREGSEPRFHRGFQAGGSGRGVSPVGIAMRTPPTPCPRDPQPQDGGSEQHEARRLGDGGPERHADDPWFGPTHRRRVGLPEDRMTALALVLVVRIPGVAEEHAVA